MPKTIKRPIFGNAADPAGVSDLEDARLIDITLLLPNPFQPRIAFDPAALDELAASIRAHGVLQPLLVRLTPGEEGTYHIATGERRWRAAQLAGLDVVPCVVRELTDRQMREVALVENVAREDLTAADLARALQAMMEAFDLSARALSERLGKNHNYVDDKTRILRDPHIVAAVEAGAIGPTVAGELADLADEEARATLLARAKRGERVRVRDVADARGGHGGAAVPDKLAATGGADGAAPAPTLVEPAMVPTPVQTLPGTDPSRIPAPDKLAGDGSPTSERRYDEDLAWHGRLDSLSTIPGTASAPPSDHQADVTPAQARVAPTPTVTVDEDPNPTTPMRGGGTSVPPGTIRLRDLHVIQLREGRDGELRQLDTADKAMVLRILRADLAWLERDGADKDA